MTDTPTTDRRTMIVGAAALAGLAALPWASNAYAAPDGSLHVIAELVAKPGMEKQLRDALVAFVPVALKEPGCSGYQLLEDKAQPGRFLTQEIWSNDAALAAHFQTPAMKAAGPQLAKILAKPLGLTKLTRLV